MKHSEKLVGILMKKKNTIKTAVLLLIIVIAFFVYLAGTGENSSTIAVDKWENPEMDTNGEVAKEEENAGDQSTEEKIFVHISGAVERPGVVEMDVDSRVFQAVDAVGGMSDDADDSCINLAAALNDGDYIYIPAKGEISSEQAGAAANISLNQNNPTPSGSVGQVSSDGKININTADSQGLQQIKGIGPATADKIIEYRQENGSFSSIEDLKKVKGIGSKTFEKLKDQIKIK